MTDITSRILALAPGLQLVSLATVTGQGEAWVRFVAGRMLPDLSIWFSTHLSSRKIGQIRANPSVHATLGASDFSATEWLQVQGNALISTDQQDRDKFWFDGLRAYISGVNDPDYAVVKIIPRRIEIGSMTQAPVVWSAE
ncbi:pyridoxamine 5'-phosphate oxidase family protein [Sedimentimonas flavescens]|uniref:Pyridoxamine 5'-phosphate oxidase family protein n=1 Tax=Sedimentimonas flavescens TaxID=2851012 RepID=A0ABT3A0P7_9RHOB|nr:pyridoxamine 5'-phosphate oxidase family protein [Sedimentimonas flavescens]MCV2879574.1 pyridoxamine 5'-phosphate oxidase family protein [Sedimentimonas flavescens]